MRASVLRAVTALVGAGGLSACGSSHATGDEMPDAAVGDDGPSAGMCDENLARPRVTETYSSAGGSSELTSLDVYGLAAVTGCPAKPVVVYVHGGAWTVGDKANPSATMYKPELFRAAGFVYVSVNYRLSPGVMHPAHVSDVAAAVAWVRGHVAAYGGDPARIAMLGHSSGAHLVALLATHPDYTSALAGVVALDSDEYDLVERAANGNENQQREIEQAFGTAPATLEDGSPMHHAVDAGAPPFLVVTRGPPDRRARADAFAAHLRDGGEAVQLLAIDALTHEELNDDLGAPDETAITPPVMAFLRACTAR